MTEVDGFQPLSIRAARQLAAPHTWVAAIAPVLVGCMLTFALDRYTEPPTAEWVVGIVALMLITSIALQSAVNTFNDYSDFITGADTADNVVDVTDASIIYNRLDPVVVKRFAIALLVVAAVTGLTLVVLSSWSLLALGLVGAASVILYSFGPTPIAYLPIGELVSGVVMGGIITVGTTTALTGKLDPMMFLYALPVIIGIGVIMQVNNTCDIDKDLEVGRRTLPILLGKKRSIRLIVALSVISVLIVAAIALVHFPFALVAIIPMIGVLGLNIRALARDPYSVVSRSLVMKLGVKQVALCTLLYVNVLFLGYLTLKG